ncbi:MAG: ComEC/Rec2 family competence protein, partial [Anaerotignum sp.]|nr:ComEC/Rec2 family competence protein [Anaerotignum sp.]
MKRPIVWSTIFTICGIYMRLGISEMICLVSVFYVILSLLYIIKKYKDFRYFGLILFTILGFVSAGFSVNRDTAEVFLKHSVYGEGVIREAGMTSSGNKKLFIQCDLRDESENTLEDVMIYGLWMEEGTFCTGDRISFYGELQPFSQSSVPGGYDEDLYLRTRGFDGKIYLDSVTVTGEDHSVSSLLANARGKVHQTLDSILPANESAVMKAMLTGEKDDIPDETYELYQNAGAVHILCISGLHMSILGLYVSLFLEKILKQSRRVSAAVTMAASVCFLIFTGFTPSAVRAVTMLCVVMAGRILFRSHDRLNEIGVAALLILLIEPLYLFHIGFQLSFITVLGLCIAAENMEEKKNKNWIDKLKDALRFSAYASLFSYPLVAYHFYTISLVGILANLIVIPLSGLLLGLGILSAVLGMVWIPAGVFAAGSVYAILRFIEITCTLLLKIPFACILTGRPSELVILLLYILLFLWIKISKRKGSWKAALAICIALWCAVFENQLFRKETTIAFLDVGQGDAAVISAYDGKTYLIDGGGKYGKEFGENVGQTVLLPYLQYLGKNHVDAVFLSHPDTDHMTG